MATFQGQPSPLWLVRSHLSSFAAADPLCTCCLGPSKQMRITGGTHTPAAVCASSALWQALVLVLLEPRRTPGAARALSGAQGQMRMRS